MKKIFSLTICSLISICVVFAWEDPIIQLEWVATYSSQDSLYNFATAIDVNGNIYVTGYSINTGTTADITTLKYDQQGNLLWDRSYNGTGNSRDMATGISCDQNGNVYVSGRSPGVGNNMDYVVIKYSPDGDELWVQRYDNGGTDIPESIKTDAAGNVYVTGTSYGTGNNDYVTICYNTDGTVLWLERFDSGNNDYATAMEIDDNANLYITGYSNSAGTGYDFKTIKYDSDGNQIWNKTYNSPSNLDEKAYSIALDTDLNVYITGYTNNSSTGNDYLTVKYSNDGAEQWTDTYDGGYTNDNARSVAIDNNNNIYITGESKGDNYTAFTTIQYNTAGEEQWIQKYYIPYPLQSSVSKAVAGADNAVYITASVYNGSDPDFCTIKYNSDGVEEWVEIFNGDAEGYDKASDISVDSTGNVYVTGQTFNGNNYDFATIKYSKKIIITPEMNGDPPVDNLAYFKNKGQLKDTENQPIPEIKYYTTNSYPPLYLTDTSLSFVFASIDTIPSTIDTIHRVDMKLLRQAPTKTEYEIVSSKPIGLEPAKGYLNYYLGHIPEGRAHVNGYYRIVYPDVYNNIDMHYYSNRGGLKYYFVVNPGGNPHDIIIEFTGANTVDVVSGGGLRIETTLGDINFLKGIVYYDIPQGNSIPLLSDGSFVQIDSNKVRFDINSYYPPSCPLMICVAEGFQLPVPTGDRNLEHSTYWGRSLADRFYDVATDASGNVYITGSSNSLDFPEVGGFFPLNHSDNTDGIVIKLDNNIEPVWGTFYGGDNADRAYGVAADNNGNVFIAGKTYSDNFPLFDPGGNAYYDSTLSGTGTKSDIFIVKLEGVWGTPIWATYYGGTTSGTWEKVNDITLDSYGNLYVVGRRDGNTPLYYQPGATNDDIGLGLILKFSNQGQQLWATAFGGNGAAEEINSVTTDINNNLLITGTTKSSTGFHLKNPGGGAYYQDERLGLYDSFIAKFNSNDLLYWSTYFGGDENEDGTGIATDEYGNIFVTGFTRSQTNFPVINSPGSQYNSYHGPFPPFTTEVYGDIYISKFNSSGVIQNSFYYGGSADETGFNITVDDANRIYVSGYTSSNNMPVINSNPSTIYSQNNLSNYADEMYDAFIIALNQSFQPIWGTYFGGGSGYEGSDEAYGITAYQNSKLFLVGATNSEVNFPLYDMGGDTYYQGPQAGIKDGFFAYFSLQAIPYKIDDELYCSEDEFNIFPNPAIETAYLFADFKVKDDLHIEIYDISGKRLFIKNYGNVFGEHKIKLDLSTFSKGMYFVQIKTNEKIINKKIVIQ